MWLIDRFSEMERDLRNPWSRKYFRIAKEFTIYRENVSSLKWTYKWQNKFIRNAKCLKCLIRTRIIAIGQYFGQTIAEICNDRWSGWRNWYMEQWTINLFEIFSGIHYSVCQMEQITISIRSSYEWTYIYLNFKSQKTFSCWIIIWLLSL